MTSQPSYSILIANFNHAELVGRAVESALHQEYPSDLVEVIVVDDGSTDDSVERLQAFVSHARFHLIAQENRGQSAAFAAGLKRATGDYVCLLDSDDRFLPNKLEAVSAHLETLAAGSAPVFLCHDLEILDGVDGAPIDSTWFGVIEQARLGSHLHISSAHHFFPFSVTSGMVFSRRLLERVVDLMPVWDWPMGSDTVFGHMAWLLTGEVHFLPDCLSSYVVHERNNCASIERGEYVHKAVWKERWPRLLRLLERTLDCVTFDACERADRQGHLARLEHAVRIVSSSHPQPQPLLSFVIDVADVAPADRERLAAVTRTAIGQLIDSNHELVWVGTADALAGLALGASSVEVPPAYDEYQRIRAGLSTARGAYLSILSAGDAPDPRFTLRHLQAHRFGSLPAVTVSDMRLISADGQLLHPGIMSLTAGWNAQAPIPAFGHLLRDWPLAPLPAMVLRRTPFLRAFFEPSVAPLDPRLTGWLLGQFLVLLGGATRLPENLLDLRLPGDATPNPSWLSRFIHRSGPVEANLHEAAASLLAAYARAHGKERRYFSAAWEQRLVRWLFQSAGIGVTDGLLKVIQQCDDLDLSTRMEQYLRATVDSVRPTAREPKIGI